MTRKGSNPQPLTPNEKKVLEFLEVYISTRGLSPSYQEIRSHFGFASFNSVQRYLKQLESKGYLHTPGENKKRAITLLHSSSALQSSLEKLKQIGASRSKAVSLPTRDLSRSSHSAETGISAIAESLSLPLLGRVAAGLPIEELEHNETFDVPVSLVRNPNKTFALRVKGQSMVEDGILDGDVILVQRQDHASNGEIVVAVVDNEATVKRFYSHTDQRNLKLVQNESDPSRPLNHVIELRPANATMTSFWYRPEDVQIQGILVGLVRQF